MDQSDEEPVKARFRSFVFTYNNPEISAEDLKLLLLQLEPLRYCFQLEEGKEGTPHFQGVIQFKNQKVKSAVDAVVKWSRSMAGSFEQALVYASKEDTRVAGPFFYNCKVPRPIRALLHGLEDKELYEWELQLLEVLKTDGNHDRNINWYWSQEGQTGKSSFAKYLCDTQDALLTRGKSADICYAIAERVAPERGEPTALDVVIVDYPKNAEKDYQFLESVKDGLLFNGKYKSRMLRFPQPHVVVFSNERPDKSELTNRWGNVYHIGCPAKLKQSQCGDCDLW